MSASERDSTEERDLRAADLAEQRRNDLERAAYERGEAAATLRARLGRMDQEIGRHKERLDAINGSVIEAKRSTDRLTDQIDSKTAELAEQIQKIATELATRDTVNEALVQAAAQVAEKADKAISTAGAKELGKWTVRGIWAACVSAGVGLFALIIQTIEGLTK